MTDTVFQERFVPRGGNAALGVEDRGEVVSTIEYHATLSGGSNSKIFEPKGISGKVSKRYIDSHVQSSIIHSS